MSAAGEGGGRRERRALARKAVVRAVWAVIRARRASPFEASRLVVSAYNAGVLRLQPEAHEMFPTLAVRTVWTWFDKALEGGEDALVDRSGDRDTSRCATNNEALRAAIDGLLAREPEMSVATIRSALRRGLPGYKGPVPSERQICRIVRRLHPDKAGSVGHHSRRSFFARYPRVLALVEEVRAMHRDMSYAGLTDLVADLARAEGLPAPSTDTVYRHLSKGSN